MPVLQQLRVRAPVRVTLLLESALGDVIAVLMVSTLLKTSPGVGKFSGFMSGFLRDAGIASAMGVVAGLLWWWLWPRLAPQRFSNTVAFGVVLALYAATHAVGGSGLLAVLAFGLILGNLPNRGDIAAKEMQFLSFHSELSFLVRSFFFVLLGVIVEFLGKAYILPILAILGALLLSRFLAVQVSRIALQGISSTERELLLMMMPRGLITAVLAVQVVEAKGEEFLFLPAMAFTTILATNLLLVAGSIRTASEVVSEEPSATPVESSGAPSE
jgi:cell volume regulation protein A